MDGRKALESGYVLITRLASIYPTATTTVFILLGNNKIVVGNEIIVLIQFSNQRKSWHTFETQSTTNVSILIVIYSSLDYTAAYINTIWSPIVHMSVLQSNTMYLY